MKSFFRFYRQLLIANFSRTLAHRVDFVNSVFSSILWGAFSIVAILTLTARSESVAGWSRAEVILLALTYAIVVGFFHIFFSRNFPKAATIIHYGELDGLLAKPVSSLLLLIGGEVSYASIIRPLLTIPLIVYVVISFHLPVTLLSVFSFSLLTIAGVAILVSIHILFVTLLLSHSYLGNIMDLGSLMISASRYPMDTLKGAPLSVILLFLPVMAAVNVPTKALIGKASPLEMVLFFGGSLLFLFFSLWLWKTSLYRYTGASG